MSFDVSINGFEDLKSKLQTVKRNVRRQAQDRIVEAAFDVQRGAKRDVPVDTGRLRSSIQVYVRADKMGATITAETNYAAAIEFGVMSLNVTRQPRPYLMPNYLKQKQELLEEFKNMNLL